MQRRVLMPPGYGVIECPSLPGCISQGETREEATHNIQETIALYIEALEAHGDPVPEDTYESFLVAI